MATELSTFIDETPLCDTHEHMAKEQQYLDNKPDIIQTLFMNYVQADFEVAGVDADKFETFFNQDDPDVRGRFEGVYPAWQAIQHTGYGEAVRLMAKRIYDIDEVTPDSVGAAVPLQEALVQPGERLRLLKEVANLDHIQTDDFSWPCLPDASGPDFFFYDMTWCTFCNGQLDVPALVEETGVDVSDLPSLRNAMHALFDKYSAVAVAVKSQHAYHRTLAWEDRADVDVEPLLQRHIDDPKALDVDERNAFGDWCWARGAELCAEYDLPFKIHTGYYAGSNKMPLDFIGCGNMCSLLAAFVDTKFVLMHISYPYNDELVALGKHYANVYVDMCWAWSIDPHTSTDFVRKWIHTAPANKLFIYGGDTFNPVASVGYTIQARAGLHRALQAEVDDGLVTEKEAIALAARFMRDNAYDCFRIEAKRATIAGV